MKARKATERPHFLRDPVTRRRRLGLKPDIDQKDRKLLAIRVFFGEPLQDYQREFVARLVDSETTDLLTNVIGTIMRAEPPKKKNKGRPPSTAAAVERDEIAEACYFHRALWPSDKHKEQVLPHLAKTFGVSQSYVDKVLRTTDPARRAEMKAAAATYAKGFEEVQRLNRLGLMNDTLAAAYAD